MKEQLPLVAQLWSANLLFEGLTREIQFAQKALLPRGAKLPTFKCYGLPWKPISSQFLEVINKTEPIIAIDINSCIRCVVLHAFLLAEARSAGMKVPNIVIIEADRHLLVKTAADGALVLYVKAGVLVSANGVIGIGSFTRPIRIDGYAGPCTTHKDALGAQILLQKSERVLDIGVNGYNISGFVRKNELASLSNVKSPETIYFRQGDEVKPHVQRLLTRYTNIGLVLKPIFGSCGYGVYIILPNNVDALTEKLTSLGREGLKDEYVLQQRIRSFPLDDSSKEDWNVRAFVANGNLISFLVRRGRLGRPINGEQGAVSQTPEVFLESLEAWARPLVKRGFANVEESAVQVSSRLGMSLYGLDFIIDPFGAAWLIEVNSGAYGVKELIALTKNVQSQKEVSVAFFEPWRERLAQSFSNNQHSNRLNGKFVSIPSRDQWEVRNLSQLLTEQLSFSELNSLIDEFLTHKDAIVSPQKHILPLLLCELLRSQKRFHDELSLVFELKEYQNFASKWGERLYLGHTRHWDIDCWDIYSRLCCSNCEHLRLAHSLLNNDSEGIRKSLIEISQRNPWKGRAKICREVKSLIDNMSVPEIWEWIVNLCKTFDLEAHANAYRQVQKFSFRSPANV